MAKIINPEMTSEEVAAMEHLVKNDMYRDTARTYFRMGFAAGKLSCLTDILNNSKLLNGRLSDYVGDQGGAAGGIPPAMEQKSPKGGRRSSNRDGKDKAGH